MKHTAYALEAILQNELKSIIAEEYKERGCSNIETHAYTQGYLCAVRRVKKILLQQKAHPSEHESSTSNAPIIILSNIERTGKNWKEFT